MQEGLEILMPFMNEERKIPVSKELFIEFLEKGSFTFDELRTKWN